MEGGGIKFQKYSDKIGGTGMGGHEILDARMSEIKNEVFLE